MSMNRDGGLAGDLEVTGTLAFRTTDENLTKLQLTLGSGEKQCNIQVNFETFLYLEIDKVDYFK